MKIGVIGLGYVGLANAFLLARKNPVIGFDIDTNKIKSLEAGISPVKDIEIKEFLTKNNEWTANFDNLLYCKVLIISTPTDYNEETNQFDTRSIESTIELVKNKFCDNLPLIIIKSTIPIGYVSVLRRKYHTSKIIFSPEFLRENAALQDNLYPSRIVVGCKSADGRRIAKLFADAAIDKNVPVMLTSPSEAEAIKLFSNTYLAMRVAFFNELDTFAYNKRLSTKNIIKGVSLDYRIGDFYNNPSFGYGGYCLPKDTKQLLANYNDIPNDIIQAVIKANDTRKKYITNKIVKLMPKIVGIYRLSMKTNSGNFRQSAILDIINNLKDAGVIVKIYEPTMKSNTFIGCELVTSLEELAVLCDLIVANRISTELTPFKDKVFTRDIFNNN